MRVQQQRFGAITVFEVVMKENWTHYNHLDSVILKKFVWNKCNKNRMCTHAKPNDYCEKGPHVISSKKNACILHGFTGGNWQLFSPLASLSYKRHSYTMYDDHACVHGCSTWSHTSHSTIPFEIMGIKISESVDTTGWREIMTLVDNQYRTDIDFCLHMKKSTCIRNYPSYFSGWFVHNTQQQQLAIWQQQSQNVESWSSLLAKKYSFYTAPHFLPVSFFNSLIKYVYLVGNQQSQWHVHRTPGSLTLFGRAWQQKTKMNNSVQQWMYYVMYYTLTKRERERVTQPERTTELWFSM